MKMQQINKITLKVKFEQNVNGVIQEAANHEKVACVQETVDTQPGELSEVKLTNINGEIGYEEKDDDVPEEVTLAKN